jgi:predicted ribosome quality control (RQC) complex YloA/Tae2 family protein
LAAYFSKSKSSGLVAVMVTEKKYVRKPKGALPGQVRVDREDVILAEPKLE